MATASSRKLSKVERDLIIRALDVLAATQVRAAKAAIDPDVEAAHKASADRTAALRSVVLNSELEL